ncbi:acyltransferase family protein [Enterobacter kobei]|uniref:acyltransferase family protein n=1 Tax=Enterobacter kobei TaxID=208224 RepID=UPI000697303E|nr:acyltransferase [Enterobacter kobei]
MIRTLQALRFLAAFMVVMHHSVRSFYKSDLGQFDHLVREVFSMGVDIFFVISGFVIYYSFERKPKGVKKFVLDRIFRIVPVYWLCLFVYLFFVLYYPKFTPYTGFSYDNFISSLLFIPSENPGGGIFPMLTVGWSLNFEMLFYAIFALAICIKGKDVAAIIIFIVLAVNVMAKMKYLPWFYSNPIIYEFCFGVLIGYVHLHTDMFKSNNWSGPAVIACISFVFMLTTPETNRLIAYGVPAAVIVASLIAMDAHIKTPDWLVTLGDSSYSLYLVHRIVITALTIPFFFNGYSHMKGVLASCVLSVIASVIMYRIFERPVTRLLKSGYAKIEKAPA